MCGIHGDSYGGALNKENIIDLSFVCGMMTDLVKDILFIRHNRSCEQIFDDTQV